MDLSLCLVWYLACSSQRVKATFLSSVEGLQRGDAVSVSPWRPTERLSDLLPHRLLPAPLGGQEGCASGSNIRMAERYIQMVSEREKCFI